MRDAGGVLFGGEVVGSVRLRDRDAPARAREPERERVGHLLGAVDRRHVAVEQKVLHSRP